MLTEDIINEIAPDSDDDLVAALLKLEPVLIAKYEISSPLRMRHFLAQTAHESKGFTTMRENLNYAVQALTAKFGHRITPAQAAAVGRNDATGQKANQNGIADIIYGGAWGKENLGNAEAGDGSRFLGRGLIQITGRSNYTSLAAAVGKSLDDTIAFLETPDGAVESAGWFWKTHGLNDLADDGDIKEVTRVINPGLDGLADRQSFLALAQANLPDGAAA